MYSRDQLSRLAQAYCRHTGFALSTLGRRVLGNDKIFIALAEGGDCRMSAGERATDYFDTFWPIDLPWPDGVPISTRRPKGRRRDDPNGVPLQD